MQNARAARLGRGRQERAHALLDRARRRRARCPWRRSGSSCSRCPRPLIVGAHLLLPQTRLGPRHARHLPGPRDGRAHGRAASSASTPSPSPSGAGLAAAAGALLGPVFLALPLDGRPRVAQGVLGGDPRRPRQLRRAPRSAASLLGVAEELGAGLRVLRLPRRGGLRHDRAHAPVAARRASSRGPSAWADAVRRAWRAGRSSSRWRHARRSGCGIRTICTPAHHGRASSRCWRCRLNLLLGYAGQLSLGHAAFFGIGAYASALLTVKLAGRRGPGSSPPLLLPALAGWRSAGSRSQLRGAYFVLLTVELRRA